MASLPTPSRSQRVTVRMHRMMARKDKAMLEAFRVFQGMPLTPKVQSALAMLYHAMGPDTAREARGGD